MVQFRRIPLQHHLLDGQRRDGADCGDCLGSNGRAHGQPLAKVAIHLGIEPNLEPTGAKQSRKATEDNDQTELPAMGEAENAASSGVEESDEDEADIEAHQLEDRLGIGVDAADQGARIVFGAVEELEVLT